MWFHGDTFNVVQKNGRGTGSVLTLINALLGHYRWYSLVVITKTCHPERSEGPACWRQQSRRWLSWKWEKPGAPLIALRFSLQENLQREYPSGVESARG